MTKYIYQQTVTQWRLPIKEDGKLGNPEIVKKFTTEIKGAQGKYVKKTDPKVKKQIKKQQAEDLFKMSVGDVEDLE
jgi:hypothetical protein